VSPRVQGGNRSCGKGRAKAFATNATSTKTNKPPARSRRRPAKPPTKGPVAKAEDAERLPAKPEGDSAASGRTYGDIFHHHILGSVVYEEQLRGVGVGDDMVDAVRGTTWLLSFGGWPPRTRLKRCWRFRPSGCTPGWLSSAAWPVRRRPSTTWRSSTERSTAVLGPSVHEGRCSVVVSRGLIGELRALRDAKPASCQVAARVRPAATQRHAKGGRTSGRTSASRLHSVTRAGNSSCRSDVVQSRPDPAPRPRRAPRTSHFFRPGFQPESLTTPQLVGYPQAFSRHSWTINSCSRG